MRMNICLHPAICLCVNGYALPISLCFSVLVALSCKFRLGYFIAVIFSSF